MLPAASITLCSHGRPPSSTVALTCRSLPRVRRPACPPNRTPLVAADSRSSHSLMYTFKMEPVDCCTAAATVVPATSATTAARAACVRLCAAGCATTSSRRRKSSSSVTNDTSGARRGCGATRPSRSTSSTRPRSATSLVRFTSSALLIACTHDGSKVPDDACGCGNGTGERRRPSELEFFPEAGRRGRARNWAAAAAHHDRR